MSSRTGFWVLKSGIETLVPQILRRAVDLKLTINKDGQQRGGGHFCLLRYNDHQGEWITRVFRFGLVPRDSQSLAFCKEKALRISTEGSTSSWMSRDPKRNQWGGAVRVHQDVIFSFSGLPEDADEALVLVLAVRLDLLTREEAQRIADLSANQKFSRLLEAAKAAI